MKKLLSFLIRHIRGLAIVSVLASAFSGICRAGLIKILDDALSVGKFSLTTYALVCVIAFITNIVAEIMGVYSVNNLMYEALIDLVKQLLRLPLRRIEEIGTHRILVLLSEDTYLVTASLKSVPTIVVQASMILGCAFYLAYVSRTAFLCIAALGIIATGTFHVTHRLGRIYMLQAREFADNIFRHLEMLTYGIKEFKLHHRSREAFVLDGLGPAADRFKRSSLIGTAIYTVNSNWSQLMFFTVMGLLLNAGRSWLGADQQRVMTGYGLTLLFLIGPVSTLTSVLADLGGASGAFEHLDEMGLQLMQLGADQTSFRGTDAPRWNRLAFRRLEYNYATEPDRAFSVGPFDLNLGPGKIVFIVGGNGSGKTTLAKLCCGLYTPSAGEICIDGRILENENLSSYHELFTVVFSDFVLFDRMFGVEGVSEKLVNDYLRLLNLQDKVKITGGAFSTIELSRGQQKRLALLVACLQDRHIYIFDEWAADQDPIFKRIFYREILPELRRQKRAVIVISHDEAYFDTADEVVLLDAGRVIFQGPPASQRARQEGSIMPFPPYRESDQVESEV
jgi:putative pyoverdin transport system ATP-binding/permease protein